LTINNLEELGLINQDAPAHIDEGAGKAILILMESKPPEARLRESRLSVCELLEGE